MSVEAKVLDPIIVRSRLRLLDYVELMKPELTGLSVFTALCGFYLATVGLFDFLLFLHTAIGTALVGGGAGALNQYIEREYDALMKRTERRALPSGRLLPTEVLLFGASISVIGVVELSLFVNLLTGFLAVLTFTTYLFLYTPLKRITPYATLVGGIPGALPPVMGWTAVRNEITIEAWVLFAVLFCWQMPHFLSLAWMYRKDYGKAGFRILTVQDPDGARTSRHILTFSVALLPASLVPALVGMTGAVSFAGALILGAAFIVFGTARWRCSGRRSADVLAGINVRSRRLFYASLIYLPVLLLLLVLDKV